MHSRAIVAAAEIEEDAITNAEWSARSIRQVRHVGPGPSEQFVVVNRNTWALIAARRKDAEVIPCTTIEPQPVHYHVRPHAPTVSNRVVDLRDGLRGRDAAPEEVEFPLTHRAARRCYRRRHVWSGRPCVTGDVIDVQRVQLSAAIVTRGNV